MELNSNDKVSLQMINTTVAYYMRSVPMTTEMILYIVDKLSALHVPFVCRNVSDFTLIICVKQDLGGFQTSKNSCRLGNPRSDIKQMEIRTGIERGSFLSGV